MLMGKALAKTAAREPERTAIIYGEKSWTYGELNSRVNRLAGAVTALGLKKGDKMAMVAKNCPEYLEVYHALAKLGVVLVPINYRLKVSEISYRLTHSDSRGIVLAPEYISLYQQVEPEVRRELDRRVLVLGNGEIGEGNDSYELALARSEDVEPEVNLNPEDPLFIGYTGGTTGRSKGVLMSNRAIVAGYLYKVLDYGFGPGDVTLNPGPFWHTSPRNFSSLALYMGGTAIVMREFDAKEYLENVQRHGVNNSMMVPTMYSAILEDPDLADYDLSSLKVLTSVGSPLSTTVKEGIIDRFGPILHEFYGATETLVMTNIFPHEIAERIRSVGRPIWDVFVKILDAQGRELPPNEVGEIYIQTPSMFSGYYNDPDKTRQVMRDGWVTLGDMGRVDEDGFLYIVDRKKDMIISGGENIYPAEIEEVLMSHPKVALAAVIGVPDQKWGEALKAVVVLKKGKTSTEEEIIDYCKERLAGYVKPRSVDFVDQLPLSTVGKVLKRKLRDQYWADSEFKV